MRRWLVERHIRQHLLRGRMDFGDHDDVVSAVDKLMAELDRSRDGLVSWQAFSEWNRRNTVERVVFRALNRNDREVC